MYTIGYIDNVIAFNTDFQYYIKEIDVQKAILFSIIKWNCNMDSKLDLRFIKDIQDKLLRILNIFLNIKW